MGDLDLRITTQENAVKVLETRVTSLENVTLRLENMILKEGQETRKILEKVLKHTQNMDKLRYNLWAKCIGAGGLIYLIVEFIIKNF